MKKAFKKYAVDFGLFNYEIEYKNIFITLDKISEDNARGIDALLESIELKDITENE